MTYHARKILELINNSTQHWTAEQIFLELKRSCPKVVLATVYNNLNSLYAEGLIQKVTLERQPDRYDKAVKHDHLVCKECNSLTDVFLQDLTPALNAQLDSPLLSYDLIISYVCPSCRQKAADTI